MNRFYQKIPPFRMIFEIGLIVIVGVTSFSVEGAFAQVSDFFSNTQAMDKRSDGTNNDPGFDPCVGGARGVGGTCSAVAATTLLSSANIGPTGQFKNLGPGAVTDNMFGVIEQPATPGICGAEGSPGVSEIGTNKLNCGNVRFDTSTQGMTIPGPTAGSGGDNDLTSAPMMGDINTISDFCATTGTDCPSDDVFPAGPATQRSAAHMGLDFTNNFSWTALTGTTANVVSSQSMTQVTAVGTTGIGTLLSPGSGDQRFILTSTFTTVSPIGATAAGTAVVNWTLTIEDPEQSGTGSGKFTQTVAGPFTYNLGPFPAAVYPTGPSQTIGDTTATIP